MKNENKQEMKDITIKLSLGEYENLNKKAGEVGLSKTGYIKMVTITSLNRQN